MTEYYIGVDNGTQGALSVIDDKLNIIDVIKYPKDNLKIMYHFLKPYAIHGHAYAAIEAPFRSINTGMEKTFLIAGHHEMNLSILNIPFEWAEPRINMKNCWRKQFSFQCLVDKEYNKELRRTKKLRDALKKESIEMCDLIFDGKADIWLRKTAKNSKVGKPCKADNDIAESLLLAVYTERIK